MQMNRNLDTHAREQECVVSRVIQVDIDRDTLADFGVVTTVVIGCWQQRELTGGGSHNLGDMAANRAVVGIDMDIHRLPHRNGFDRAFIHIGGDLHTLRIGFLRYRGGGPIHELPHRAWDLHNDPIHGGDQVLYRRGAKPGGLDGANNLPGAHHRADLDIQVNEGARSRWHNVDHRAGDLGIVSRVVVVASVNEITYHSADKDDRQDERRKND